MTIAGTLAKFAVQTHIVDLPPLALERAEMCISSTLASVAAGVNIESARIIRELALEDGGAQQATVWFNKHKLPVTASARVNALTSDAAASDDSDMRSIAHIGTIISTTSIAMAEHIGASGAQVLEAMIIGYEVAGRIDESLTPGRMRNGFHGSFSTVFGGAVAVGKLLQLTEEQMTQAIAIAATSIGGMAIAADTSCAREYHAGMAASSGVQAALAAKRGFKSETRIFEAPRGFLSALGGTAIEDITKDFGESWDICTDMAIKLMPGAHPFHAVAQAAANAATEGDVLPENIQRIVISAAQMKDWMAPHHPTDLITAAHSVVYFVAAAIVDRGFTWKHITKEKMLDPVIAVIQDKVVFDPNPAPLPDRFTHRHGGTVIIELKDGRKISNTCRAARGSGPTGVTWDEVESKFNHLMPLSGLDSKKIQRIRETVRHFRDLSSVTPLTDLLRVN
ncbi:MmgE/PrpD family protein [Zwartia vadi]|uniref:MmgE/PrpD family protein n=1 Tax=Zwartia vadi TaxID=3058168 RepID=UPI0025B293EC|nr:MmgE/PrpD family protein [Zwartia vadi]MDN3987631.1 MmgE/PrpD family protein [Zwartia vadi]